MAYKKVLFAIIALLLIQIIHIQAQNAWRPFKSHSSTSVIRSNSFMKLYKELISANKLSNKELFDILNYMKTIINLKKERFTEYWLLREG